MGVFNDNLRHLREKAGLSIRDIAQELDIPYPTYAKYELYSEPKYETLKKIAYFFNVSIDTLIGYTANEYENYKQWLLSTNQISIDDNKEPIKLSFFFGDNPVFPNNIIDERYILKIESKEGLLQIAKFIEKIICMARENDTNTRIIGLLKYVSDLSCTNSDVTDFLQSAPNMENYFKIIKYITVIERIEFTESNTNKDVKKNPLPSE